MYDLHESEHRFLKTWRGEKLHIVNTERKSMMAVGTDGVSDHAARCGQMAEEWIWRRRVADREEICDRCWELHGSPGDLLNYHNDRYGDENTDD